jgi:hypothetical protein
VNEIVESRNARIAECPTVRMLSGRLPRIVPWSDAIDRGPVKAGATFDRTFTSRPPIDAKKIALVRNCSQNAPRIAGRHLPSARAPERGFERLVL